MEDMIAQITFVLRRQVHSPKDFILEDYSLLDDLHINIRTFSKISMASV